MADVGAIRDAIKTRLATISGLRPHDVWPDTLSPPAAMVVPLSQTNRLTFSGNYKHHVFEVTTAVQIGTLRTAQDALDAYWSDTGGSSIEAAIRGDETLGGSVLGIPSIEGTEYGVDVVIGEGANAVTYLGCKHVVEVMTA